MKSTHMKNTVPVMEWDVASCPWEEEMECCLYEYYRSSPPFIDRYFA